MNQATSNRYLYVINHKENTRILNKIQIKYKKIHNTVVN